jgi:hypothetical protein
MRSNAGWSSGGVLSGTLTVGVASGSVDALIITPGAAASLPAKLDTSTAGSGVQISSAWTVSKSGGVAVLTAQGNGSIIGIGQGGPNFLQFQNNGGGSVLEVMDQAAGGGTASVGSTVRILNAPTGNPATALIQTAGSSANRSIQLVPAGAGTIQAPTMVSTDNSTAIATTAFVKGAVTGGGPPVTISDTAPASPAVGALWWDSVGGQLYVWYTDPNTSQWVIAGSGGPVGSTTTPLADGVAAIGSSATYARADHVHPVVAMNDNRIINGDMRIDQRGAATGGGATAIGYTVDRWQFVASLTTKGAWSRSTPSGNAAFPYCLGFQSNSAYTVLAGDYFVFLHRLEADAVSDFAWGTASAQPVTLSFWAQASVAGTFGGAIRNMANTRSYPFSFALIANAWTKIAIAIPGDTAGTWVMSGNAAAMDVVFDLGSGASNRAAAGVWIAGNFLGATGAASILATNAAFFNLTGVKLETGSVATPFNQQSLAKSTADCQRYYSVLGINQQVNSPSAGSFSQTITLPVTMRAGATVAFSGMSYANASGITLANGGSGSIGMQATASGAGQAYYFGTVTASAEL